MKKKILSLVLAVCVIFTVMPLMTITAGAVRSGDWEYSVNLDGASVSIIKYHGNSEHVIIPQTIDGFAVTALIGSGGFGWSLGVFDGNTTIKTVIIHDDITEMGFRAFNNCTSLESVTLGRGLTKIESQVFRGCTSLETILIPENITSIGDSAFAASSLEAITFMSPNPPFFAFYAWGIQGVSRISISTIYVPIGARQAYATANVIGGSGYEIVEIEISRVTVMASAGGTATGGGVFMEGERFTLTATPSAGHVFGGWFAGNTLVSSEAILTQIAESNILLEARFTPNPYTINVTAGAGGTATGGGVHNHGASVTLRATPDSGYTFGGWFDGSSLISTERVFTFTATTDRNLQARFADSSVPLTTADALHILRHVAGIAQLTREQHTRYGLSGNVNTSDALNILRLVAGIIDKI
ncbi:MAG: leucine-rich repeat protein [Oscillospiraceae bacterium]|nr:leucine-rich repeat protein [Oscillospiraceae bacterium]